MKGPFTTSLTVAEFFGKAHHHVLRAIREAQCSSEFHSDHFYEVLEIIDFAGSGGVWRSKETSRTGHYRMTREGFMFLALAYRGAKAARIREAFITDPSSYPDDLNWEYAP